MVPRTILIGGWIKSHYMDRVAPDVRSRTMASIKGRDTSIEKAFEVLVSRSGFSFLKHPNWLGSPDIAFPKRGVVVFLDSCFWHKCPIHFRPPKSRKEYWEPKIARNVARDATIRETYRVRGWMVMEFWEHSVTEDTGRCVQDLIAQLRTRRRSTLIPPSPKRTPGGGVRFRTGLDQNSSLNAVQDL
jgi:DNA mismatch endonuclease (patch repair protein)